MCYVRSIWLPRNCPNQKPRKVQQAKALSFFHKHSSASRPNMRLPSKRTQMARPRRNEAEAGRHLDEYLYRVQFRSCERAVNWLEIYKLPRHNMIAIILMGRTPTHEDPVGKDQIQLSVQGSGSDSDSAKILQYATASCSLYEWEKGGVKRRRSSCAR